MRKNIYFDYAASRPVRREVIKEMNRIFEGPYFANSESIHTYGFLSRSILAESVNKIKNLIQAPKRSEVIFTSGGTESNALALSSISKTKGAVLISAIEHSSVHNQAKQYAKDGRDILYIPVNKNGVVDIFELKKILNSITELSFVSVMLVNNEIGTIQPLKKISEIIKNKFPDALIHTDASQAPLFLDINPNILGADLMTLCSHKIYGPKGIGALYVSDVKFLEPLFLGGSQQSGIRAGTLPIELIAGFTKAFELSIKEREKTVLKIKALEDYLIKKLRDLDIDYFGSDRAPIALNFSCNFTELDSETLVSFLSTKGISVSSQSACMGSIKHNPRVFDAIGVNPRNNIRVSFGVETTRSDIDYFITVLKSLNKSVS